MLVAALSDTSLVNAPDLRTQFRYVVQIANDDRLANIMHCGLSRCHRATRPVMAVDVRALIHTVVSSILI